IPDAPAEALERARQWLALQPAAIEGQGGDARTFATACGLRDLGVSEAQAVELLSNEWNSRCSPPWSVAELETKAANAFRYAETDAGQYLGRKLPTGTAAVYVDVERLRTTELRLAVWCYADGREPTKLPLLLTDGVRLSDPNTVKALIESVQAAQAGLDGRRLS